MRLDGGWPVSQESATRESQPPGRADAGSRAPSPTSGVSVFPIRADGSKAPAIPEWTPYQSEIANEAITATNKILTAEASGIAPTFAMAQVLGVPMVYARKGRRLTMPEAVFSRPVAGRTKEVVGELVVSSRYLRETDRLLIIDDILGTGGAAVALAEIALESGASICGFGFLIDKLFEQGRSRLARFAAPVIALSRIDRYETSLIVR